MADKPRIEPIDGPVIHTVASFLARNMNSDLSAEGWARGMSAPWLTADDDRGVCLRVGDTVVGAALAFRSRRNIDGRIERFCNLGAFCVIDAYRPHSVRLLRSLLRDRDTHFTDLSPSGVMPDLNRRLGFEDLDTTTTLVPNVRVPLRRARVVTDHAAIAGRLDERSRRVFEDHRASGAALHHLIITGGRPCLVISRRDRRRGIRGFRTVLWVSDPEVFAAGISALTARYLREGSVATLIERRIAPVRVPGALPIRHSRTKMFRSRTLGASAIDDLYSELTEIPW